jgi:cell division protein ZapE
MSREANDAPSLTEAYEHLLVQRGLIADEAQRAVVLRLAKLADDIKTSRGSRWLPRWLSPPVAAPRGIYLWGSVGRGKTLLMDLLQSGLPAGSSRRLHFHVLMREVHETLAQLATQQRPLQQVARTIAGEARVLCLDELLVNDIGDAMILHGLLAALQQHGIALVITSNQPPSGLYRNGLQRERFLPAIQLLNTQLDVLELTGSIDYRLRQLQQAGTYVMQADQQQSPLLAALFAQLAGDAPAHSGATLAIEGRHIPVRRAAAGIAWFDFSALCEGARSTADYLALATQLHTVFVSPVPQLDALHDDAARRFISLVDVLYDSGVTLVVGAAVAPAQLYQGSRLAAEFARTASRLIEMGSEEYLSRARRGGD